MPIAHLQSLGWGCSSCTEHPLWPCRAPSGLCGQLHPQVRGWCHGFAPRALFYFVFSQFQVERGGDARLCCVCCRCFSPGLLLGLLSALLLERGVRWHRVLGSAGGGANGSRATERSSSCKQELRPLGLKDSRRQLAFLPGFSSGSCPRRSHSSLPQIPPHVALRTDSCLLPFCSHLQEGQSCTQRAKRAKGAAPELRGRMGSGQGARSRGVIDEPLRGDSQSLSVPGSDSALTPLV